MYSGTYYENIVVNKQLFLEGIDTGGGKPVLEAVFRDSAITVLADGIRLEGFIVTNSGDKYDGITVRSNDNNITGNLWRQNKVGFLGY